MTSRRDPAPVAQRSIARLVTISARDRHCCIVDHDDCHGGEQPDLVGRLEDRIELSAAERAMTAPTSRPQTSTAPALASRVERLSATGVEGRWNDSGGENGEEERRCEPSPCCAIG